MASNAELPEQYRYNQTIKLPDGRNLGFAEAGPSTGFPFFMFHGFPGTRLEIRGLEDIARRHNIRVIATDRPGYGLSTFQPNRRITDWPADVQCLAQHLHVERYAVLGGSGGGPYALACARAIPPNNLFAVGLLASAAPWEAGTWDVPWSSRLGSIAATYCPSFASWFINTLIGVAKKFSATNMGKNLLDGLLIKAAATAGKEIPDSEKHPDAVAARRERALRIFFEPFAQGSKGLVQEAYLLTHSYGFHLGDVCYDKIQIWHGTKDRNSPIRMVRYMSEQLPHCHMHEFAGETHFSIMKHLEEVVTRLVPVDEPKPYTGIKDE